MRENRTAERRRCAVLVSDDADVGRLLASNLAPELEVHVASTIREACDLFEGLRRVDLAFLDLELSGGNTDDLLERLARWPNSIRVLLAQPLGTSAAAMFGRTGGGGTTGDRSSYGQALKHRHLAHLVLCKPLALPVVQAIESMVLDLPGA